MDRESAGLIALPYSGGFLEQPARTMQAVEVVQVVFADRLRAEFEKQRKKARGSK